jgi:asparagine synthase (glutamine-hydrolysing)
MRQVWYLNLTRFVQTLLDRKDRMSMAVGLEVRVPFCDHRLVEYAFNIHWRMHRFDGREKSVLRGAVADLLPRSILQRPKVPYPTIQDPAYEQALRAEMANVLSDASSPVLPLLDANVATALLASPVESTGGLMSRARDGAAFECLADHVRHHPGPLTMERERGHLPARPAPKSPAHRGG